MNKGIKKWVPISHISYIFIFDFWHSLIIDSLGQRHDVGGWGWIMEASNKDKKKI